MSVVTYGLGGQSAIATWGWGDELYQTLSIPTLAELDLFVPLDQRQNLFVPQVATDILSPALFQKSLSLDMIREAFIVFSNTEIPVLISDHVLSIDLGVMNNFVAYAENIPEGSLDIYFGNLGDLELKVTLSTDLTVPKNNIDLVIESDPQN